MKEQMSVIRRDNEVLNARCRQLADCSAKIVDHRVHHLLCLVWESGLARVIDLLRSNDDHLSAINLLFEFCGRKTEEFIQSQIHQIRNARGGKLLPCWKIRKKRVFNSGTQLSVLFDHAEAARCARQKSSHAERRDT